jgi:hypothetical protein
MISSSDLAIAVFELLGSILSTASLATVADAAILLTRLSVKASRRLSAAPRPSVEGGSGSLSTEWHPARYSEVNNIEMPKQIAKMLLKQEYFLIVSILLFWFYFKFKLKYFVINFNCGSDEPL